MAKKKKSASPRQPVTLNSNSSMDAASGAVTVVAEDSSPNHNDDIKVEIFEDVIKEDCFADMNNDSTIVTPKQTQLVGAIDQGTSSTRFLVFTVPRGRIAASAQMEHAQLYPSSTSISSSSSAQGTSAAGGWHEHDPVTLWQNTAACMSAVCRVLRDKCNIELNGTTGGGGGGGTGSDTQQLQLAAIGITNQRETVISWNRVTGKPYYNAIVWDDARTSDIAASIIASGKHQQLTATTGLPVSSYFAGTKVKWLLDHVKQLRVDVMERPEQVCFGTVDAWLLFQLTGTAPKSESTGRKLKGVAGAVNTGGVFKTDVTNASRWLFMDLATCQWDAACIETVCAPHVLPISTLPEICPSSYNDLFGVVSADCGLLPASAFAGVPLSAVLGDQQAALFGQAAHTAGHAKNTYGTGLFLMMNTGVTAVTSTHGLLTTVAYQIGTTDAPVYYALEGSVSHSGSTIQWLRDQLGIIKSAAESETLAKTVASNDGLYFCPAFSGLFAPHWRPDARGCIVGLTASHNKGHVCRAALEAAAYQTKEVFDAIVKDSGVQLKSLKVDGGCTMNKLLMQFQADIINVPVRKPRVMETTAMGAAFAAGLAVGAWKDLDEIQQQYSVAEIFEPKMSAETRARNVAGWNKAVTRSLGWVCDDSHMNGSTTTDTNTISTQVAEKPCEPKPVVVVVEEEKKSQELEEAKPANEVSTARTVNEIASDIATYVGEVNEVLNGNATQCVPIATGHETTFEPKLATNEAAGFSTATLALTAGAALAVGVLVGLGARKR